MTIFNKKKRKDKALEIINSHWGKKRVYEAYLRMNPQMAEKYLQFVTNNGDVTYISWNKEKQRFDG
jgi:hypothetical protein